jgi:FAD/FMN-containing dehydrogenase
MTLAEELKQIIKGEVLDDTDTREKYSRDASLFKVVPAVVVRPVDVADIQALVRFVSAEKQKGRDITLSPRSAGTCMSGGSLTDSIMIDTMAHFNHVLEVGDDYAVTEPGVFFRDFDKETKKKGLELPSYTASRELCAVGGMVGNNAGGEKHLKYGKTDAYVEELDVVMADGEVHTLKAGADTPYTAPLAALLTKNHELIEAHKPKVRKNSAGYAIWDMDPAQPNLARLMVGAQGTLGIITKIKFKLVKPKPFAAMTVMFVSDLQELGALVPGVLAYQPDSFESYDDNTFKLATKYFPEFALQMKSGIIGLGISFLPEVLMVLMGGVPKLVLLAEFRADTQEEATRKAEKLARDIKEHVKHVKVRVAKNEAAARKYWVVRRESFALLRSKVRGKRTAPFIDDFVVPPTSLPNFLPKLEIILDQYHLIYTVAGHVGDGNFHIIPLIDPKDKNMPHVIEELSKKVYDLVFEFQGSISGEHNDGYVRTPFVEQMFGHEMYALFGEVKKLFDPLGIFNPGKKVDMTFKEAATHLDLGK